VFARWRQCALPSCTPQSTSTPYRCCPLLSHFEYIDRRTCLGIFWAGHFPPKNCPFTRRDLDPYQTYGYLGPPESKSRTASRSVQPFLHSSRQRVPILYNGPPLFPSKFPISMGIWGSNTRFFGRIRIHFRNRISIGSAVFARLTIVTDRETDHATPSVAIGRIYFNDADLRAPKS